MSTETTGQTGEQGKSVAQEPAKDESMKEKWDASWERVAIGVGAAAGGGLLAALWIGVGPAALAGAAGYLAWRQLRESRKEAVAGHPH